jgi:hypothetical protein
MSSQCSMSPHVGPVAGHIFEPLAANVAGGCGGPVGFFVVEQLLSGLQLDGADLAEEGLATSVDVLVIAEIPRVFELFAASDAFEAVTFGARNNGQFI